MQENWRRRRDALNALRIAGMKGAKRIALGDGGAMLIGGAIFGSVGLWFGTIGIVGIGAAFALPLVLPFALLGAVVVYAANKFWLDYFVSGPAPDDAPTEFSAFVIESEKVWGALKGTIQHQDYLRKVMKSSRHFLIIRSAFISDIVVNDAFIAELQGALLRGVTVHLEWGYRMRDVHPSIHCKRAVWHLDRLFHSLPDDLRGAFRMSIAPTHIKEISVDDNEGSSGSFNWLSNGARHRFANAEKSVVLMKPEFAKEIRLDAEAIWDEWKYIPKRPPRRMVQ
ncbi:MAG: hypothetical protein ACE5FS_14090 [Paracoccaceae bacterium]